jgi:hypothetical protein
VAGSGSINERPQREVRTIPGVYVSRISPEEFENQKGQFTEEQKQMLFESKAY